MGHAFSQDISEARLPLHDGAALRNFPSVRFSSATNFSTSIQARMPRSSFAAYAKEGGDFDFLFNLVSRLAAHGSKRKMK
jgi:hypothetical protein